MISDYKIGEIINKLEKAAALSNIDEMRNQIARTITCIQIAQQNSKTSVESKGVSKNPKNIESRTVKRVSKFLRYLSDRANEGLFDLKKVPNGSDEKSREVTRYAMSFVLNRGALAIALGEWKKNLG